MSNGMATWNGQGQAVMSTDDYTYQVIYNSLHSLATEGEVHVAISGFDPSTCSAVILPVDPVSYSELGLPWNGMPYMVISTGKIDVYKRNPNFSHMPQSRIRFRLLVMKYK